MTTPKILVTSLREYKTSSGSTYFIGKWGGARVVLLPDDKAPLTGREVARWNMYLEEGSSSPDETRDNPKKPTFSNCKVAI